MATKPTHTARDGIIHRSIASLAQVPGLNWLAVLQQRPATRLLHVNVIIAGVTFATGVLLARALSPDARGSLANLILWPTLLAHITLAGVQMPLSRATAIQPGDAAKNYRTGLLAVALTSALALFAYSIGLFWTGLSQSSSLGLTAAMIAALIIPFTAWNTLQLQMELGRHNLGLYNYGRASFTLVYFVMVAAFWYSHSREPVDYLWAFIVAAIFAAASTHVIVHRTLPRQSVGASGDVTNLIKTFRTAWPFALSMSLITMATSADKIAVSLFFGSYAMGQYVVALALSQVQSMINEAISPLFFIRLAQNDTIEIVNSGWLGMRLRQSILINGIIGAAMVITAPVLLPLIYGLAYADTIGVVALLVPAMCLRGMMRPFEEVLKGGNRPLSQSFAILTMTGVFCAGAALAAWAGSLQGVALALLASSLTGLMLVAGAVSRKSGLGLAEVLLPSFKDAACLISEVRGIMRK